MAGHRADQAACGCSTQTSPNSGIIAAVVTAMRIIVDDNSGGGARARAKQSSDDSAGSPLPWLLEICATGHAGRK
jgi:hypothetical protein